MNRNLNWKKWLILWICSSAFSLAGLSQVQHEIRISDKDRKPLEGVAIRSSTGGPGWLSDADGIVVLPDIPANTILTFIYLGYETQDQTLARILEENGEVVLLAISANLETAIVIGRRNESSEKVFRQVEIIDRKTLELGQSTTTVDALEKQAGIFVQRSQMGGGSPILRGFEANRVLLVVDGVRMNNAIYRNGHLQNAITIDAGQLERIEVLFGPGALTYGSDALGGVIHFRTKTAFPLEQGKKFGLNVYARYASANQEKTTHLDYQSQYAKWAISGSATVTDYGDLRAGNRRLADYPDFGKQYFYPDRVNGEDQIVPNVRLRSKIAGDTIQRDRSNWQIPSAYSQIDLSQQILFRATKTLLFRGNIQYSTSTEVPRYDQLSTQETDPTDFRFAEWSYGPQERFLTSLSTTFDKPSKIFDRAQIIAAFQDIREERIKRRFGSVDRNHQVENVQVAGITLDMAKEVGPSKFQYGLDFQYNQVESEAWDQDIETQIQDFTVLTRFPSQGSKTRAAGAFFNYQWENGDSLWMIEAGIRYSINQLESKFGLSDPIPWPESYIEPGIENFSDQITWGLGWKWRHPAGWRMKLSAGSAFRAPNLDDFTKIRDRGGFITIPNPDLKPEQSTNFEYSIGKTFSQNRRKRFELDILAYYTQLKDAIVRQAFPLPNGNEFLIVGEDTLTTIANVNAEQAYIYGVGASLKWVISEHWEFGSRFDYTYGRNKFQKTEGDWQIDTLVPLAHIPPMYGSFYLSYSKDRFRGAMRFLYQRAKKPKDYGVNDITEGADGQPVLDRFGTSDNLDYSPFLVGPDGAIEYQGVYAWQTLNFYFGWEFNSRFELDAAVENVLDSHYRTFSSGISAPGINVILTFRARF